MPGVVQDSGKIKVNNAQSPFPLQYICKPRIFPKYFMLMIYLGNH